MKELNFYFDYLSPFSYFAYLNLLKLKDELALKVNFRPVALGSLLNHWEIKGPGEVPPKREFLLKQCLRYAQREGIPFTTPKTHPFNSLYALRLSLLSSAGVHQEKIIHLLWKAGWEHRIDMGSPDELERALKNQGFNFEEIYELSFSREAKSELKSNIKEAIGHGAFGVPSFVYEGELFWGNDSLRDLKAFILGKDLLDREKLTLLLNSTPRAAGQSL